jgi:hypothetical protein
MNLSKRFTSHSKLSCVCVCQDDDVKTIKRINKKICGIKMDITRRQTTIKLWLKLALHEQQNCCNLQQNLISTHVNWKCLYINYKSQGNMCRHFYLTCVEIRFCHKLQQFCCSCNSTLNVDGNWEIKKSLSCFVGSSKLNT